MQLRTLAKKLADDFHRLLNSDLSERRRKEVLNGVQKGMDWTEAGRPTVSDNIPEENENQGLGQGENVMAVDGKALLDDVDESWSDSGESDGVVKSDFFLDSEDEEDDDNDNEDEPRIHDQETILEWARQVPAKDAAVEEGRR